MDALDGAVEDMHADIFIDEHAVERLTVSANGLGELCLAFVLGARRDVDRNDVGYGEYVAVFNIVSDFVDHKTWIFELFLELAASFDRCG